MEPFPCLKRQKSEKNGSKGEIMSFITDLTRMWLTRSVKPFTFKNEYDEKLEYEECENLDAKR